MKMLLILLATLLGQANAEYAAGNYSEAADLYSAVIAENPSADAYYNLGNACFKQGELAQAILAYERCLRINPSHKDAQFNLRFAQSRIVDNIEDSSTFFLSSALKHVRNSASMRTWLILSIVCFWLLMAGLLFFLLGNQVAVRKIGFYSAMLLLILSITFGANAFSLHHRDSARSEAIITQGVVNAKSAPDRSGTDLFTLHEGTEVYIGEVIGNWCQIRVGNNVGWINLEHLERI